MGSVDPRQRNGTPEVGWHVGAGYRTIWPMNQESLERANAFLAAVAARADAGELVDLSPAELGREIGVAEPLAAARAIRALLARRRLEAVDGRYRLLDPRPIDPGEREQVPRPRRPRQRAARKSGEAVETPARKRTAYSDIGREAVERLVELGREVGTLRGALRTAREEAREAQAGRDDAERRASGLAARVKELEARAEMAESNLRTLLAAARGAGRDAPVGDTEMEAILGVLRGGQDGEPDSA
jgi:chromosome segregation ATPase